MGRYFPDLPARTLSQMGDVDDNPVHLVAEEVFAKYPVAFLWGRSSGSSGEHPKGLALDFSVLAYGGGVNNPGPANKALGDAIANYLWANRARMGVWYVIWNRRIISTNRSSYAFGRWVAYNGSSPHTDHVHVSFYAANIYQPPSGAQPEPLPEDELPSMDEFLSTKITLTAGERDRYQGYPESISIRSLLVHAGAGTWDVERQQAEGIEQKRYEALLAKHNDVLDQHVELLANVRQQETTIHNLAAQVADLIVKFEAAHPGDPEGPRGEVNYTVAKGDTLRIIAERFHVTVDAIVSRNGLTDPDKIFVGQVLIIPEEGDES